jgi:sensor c-di-GMP phosphodiesterase-like protein
VFVSPSRKKLVAIVAGVLLAGLPVLAFNLWLDGFVQGQSQEEAKSAARRTIALGEARISQVAAMLEALHARGIDSCRPTNLEIMRQGTFAVTPIKEISIVAGDGRTLCADFGSPFEQRRLISSEPLSPNSDLLLEVVRVGERAEQMVRIRKANGVGVGLAALMPVEQLIVFLSSQGTPLYSYARMSTRAGVVIGESGVPPEDPESRVTASLASQRYGLQVTMSLPRIPTNTNSADVRTVGAVASGALAVLLFGFLIAFRMLLPQRQPDNPIAELERALKAGEFVPYYQPVVDIRSGRLRGAEVLMRWRKPDGTVVPPVSFIPLAESSGLILDLTRALMRRVCDEAGSAFGRRPHLKVGFNMTARHFADEEIVRDVRDIFGDSSIRLSQVVLEVTERQPLDNLTETRRVIAALQGLGVRIAIDDVGTGHSGLSYMLKLGVDIIKIDKMFIDSMSSDRHSNTIIETLIDLAQNMRMDVIAEGVEQFEQVVQLRELGIRAAQGFVFSPPLPGSSFLQLLEAIDPLKATLEEQSEAAAPKQARPLVRFAS